MPGGWHEIVSRTRHTTTGEATDDARVGADRAATSQGAEQGRAAGNCRSEGAGGWCGWLDVTARRKGGEQSPPDPDEVLDPAYPDIETQRADIAERARIMDQTMAEIEKRAEVIAGAIRKVADTKPKGRVKKDETVSAEELNRRRAQIHDIATHYAMMAPITPPPMQLPAGAERIPPRPNSIEMRKQITAVHQAAGALDESKRSARTLRQALAGISPEVFRMMPLALFAQAETTLHGKTSIGGETLRLSATEALQMTPATQEQRGRPENSREFSIALTLSADILWLTGSRHNSPQDGRYNDLFTDLLTVVFSEIGVSAEAETSARAVASLVRKNEGKDSKSE